MRFLALALLLFGLTHAIEQDDSIIHPGCSHYGQPDSFKVLVRHTRPPDQSYWYLVTPNGAAGRTSQIAMYTAYVGAMATLKTSMPAWVEGAQAQHLTPYQIQIYSQDGTGNRFGSISLCMGDSFPDPIPPGMDTTKKDTLPMGLARPRYRSVLSPGYRLGYPVDALGRPW